MTTLKFRNSQTGHFMTFGQWCDSSAEHPQRTASFPKRPNPKEAAEHLKADEDEFRKAEWLSEVIHGLSLPSSGGFCARGLTIGYDGSWYGDGLEKLTLALNNNRRLAKTWGTDFVTVE